MSEATLTQQAPAPISPAAPPPAANPAEAREAAREARLQAQIAKVTQAMGGEVAMGEKPAAAPATKAPSKVEPKTPPKGPDGKFLPRAKATDAPHPVDDDTSTDDLDLTPPPQPEEQPATPASLDEVRSLFSAGKMPEALEALGLDPAQYAANSKSFAALRHEKQKLEKRAAQANAQIAAKEQQLESKAQSLLEQVRPLYEAKQALESGDLDTFIKLATNGECDAAEFSRRLIFSKHSKDPHTERVERELRELRKQLEEKEQRERQQQEQMTQAQQREAYLAQMQDELTGSSDPRISKAATKPAFLQRVLAIQEEHYDPRARITLPFAQAADLALEQIYSEQFSNWSDVFETGSGPSPAVTVQGSPTPVKQGARAPRTLKQNQAAEASAPGRKLSLDQITRKYEEQLKRAMNG